MRYQRFDLNLLGALRALLTMRSVTRAAESLHLSQSAMSGILSRLRDYFDDPLIVQKGRRMELTPLAESMVGKVNDLLLMVDATLGSAAEFDPGQSNRNFVMVASDNSIRILLTNLLRHIAEEAPHITFEFRHVTGVAYQELESGEVDFIISPDWHETEGFASCPLFEDDYRAVVDEAHEGIGESISLEAYLANGHVVVDSRGVPMFDAWFEKKYPGLRRVHVRVPNFGLLPCMVVGTQRIATMHARLAAQACEQFAVRSVPLEFQPPRFTARLQWHKYRDRDPALLWIRDKLLEESHELGPVL